MAQNITSVSLPKLLEVKEKRLLDSDSAEIVILQPKYDGCQAIILPGYCLDRPEGLLATTRKGQVIPRLQAFCDAAHAAAEFAVDQVFFCEFEPSPWSEAFKSKLSGNLYTDVDLPFDTRLVAFDTCTSEEFLADTHRQGQCRDRLEVLDTFQSSVKSYAGVSFEISPWTEMPYNKAHALCESSNRETPDGTRCMVLDVLCEGGVIRWNNKAEKIKAKKDQDVAVLYAVQSAKNQRGWVVVDTKDPSDIFPVFGGVPKNHTEHVGTVVEVVKLIVTGFKGAGNPTFSRSRATEKDFDCSTFHTTHAEAIAEVIKKYKLSVM
jgi:hypothetical protein